MVTDITHTLMTGALKLRGISRNVDTSAALRTYLAKETAAKTEKDAK